MARPKKYDIDPNQVEKLASFGCSKSLLTKSYSTNLTKGAEKGKMRLRQMQWRAADKGNVTMLIWLGKQILGQADKSEVTWENPVDGVEFIDV